MTTNVNTQLSDASLHNKSLYERNKIPKIWLSLNISPENFYINNPVYDNDEFSTVWTR